MKLVLKQTVRNEKKNKKVFEKTNTKYQIQTESFFFGKTSDETMTGRAIVWWLLENVIVQKTSAVDIMPMENFSVLKKMMHF